MSVILILLMKMRRILPKKWGRITNIFTTTSSSIVQTYQNVEFCLLINNDREPSISGNINLP